LAVRFDAQMSTHLMKGDFHRPAAATNHSTIWTASAS
jgi:hypothetical protein